MSNSEEKGKLFVGGLSWDTTQTSLLTYFSQFGEVSDCVVVMNPTTGKSRGFGFVTFKDPSCVETVQAAGPHILDGKQIDPNGCNRKRVNKGQKSAETSRKKLFVGGLPANIDEAQLREGFSKYGKVNDVVIVYDQQKQRPRGFGFLTFDAEESVDRVVRERYVQINGKQVECKRAEPRDAQALVDAPGMMMLAQAPDGTVGLVSAQPAAGSALFCPPGAELANAYRAMAPELMQPAMQGGVRLMMPGLQNSQYFMLAPGGSAGSGSSYFIPGAGGNAGMAFLPSAGVNQHPGFVLPGGGSGGVMVPGPGGTSYLVPSSTGAAGNYFIPGSGSGGVLVAGPNGTGTQYLMTYPSGASALGGMGPEMNAAAAAAAYGYGSAANPYGVQLPQAVYTYAKTEPSGAGTSLSAADSVLSEKSAPTAAAASYPIISPYTLGLVGGPGESQEDGALRPVLASGENQSTMTPAAGQLGMTQRMGYYLLPSYQAQLPGLSASVLAGDNAAQSALLAGSPSLAYTRLSSPGALSHHGYHPYRR